MADKKPVRPRVRRRVHRTSDYVPTAEAAEREIWRVRRIRHSRRRQDALFVTAIIAVVLGLLAYHFGFTLVIARGTGMSPTIESGSVVLCVKQSVMTELIYPLMRERGGIQRNDLVLIDYRSPDEAQAQAEDAAPVRLIRRVIGLGGDMVDTAAGEMILNRDVIVGDLGTSDLVYPVTVPAGALFVMGDHRSLCVDSRDRAFGYVDEAAVIGRPIFTVWPVIHIGPLS